MFGASFDGLIHPVLAFAAVTLTAFVVRWMDDLVDGEFPTGHARETTVALYSLLALALACVLDAQRALALFLGSYSLGMWSAGSQRLPLGLTPWQEALGAIAASVAAAGWALALAALAALVAIQAADDLHDAEEDLFRGAPNWVYRWGRAETVLVGLIGLLVAALLEPALLVTAFGAVAVVQSVSGRWHPGRNPSFPEPGVPAVWGGAGEGGAR